MSFYRTFRQRILLIFLVALPLYSSGQTHKSIKSYIRFFSEAPKENIEAINIKGTSLINLEAGEIAFSIPIRGFEFEKALMKEHFNENYLESEKYPTATFKGKLVDFNANTSATQTAKAVGVMSIHGVARKMEIEGEIKISGNYVKVKAKFPIRVADFNIKIPKVVFYNIAEVVDVTVIFDYARIN